MIATCEACRRAITGTHVDGGDALHGVGGRSVVRANGAPAQVAAFPGMFPGQRQGRSSQLRESTAVTYHPGLTSAFPGGPPAMRDSPEERKALMPRGRTSPNGHDAQT